MEKMKANVFYGKDDIRVEEVPLPRAGVGDAVVRITLTTICGTDLHIVRGEYPMITFVRLMNSSARAQTAC